jgi:hypothetical protein
MKFPLRSLPLLTAGLLCAGACLPGFAGQFPQARSSSFALQEAVPGNGSSPSSPEESVIIPGPLRSFLRMAGISQEVPLDDVLPMLARNALLWGYDSGRQTEFLVLVNRYVRQARELQLIADPNGTIHVAGCDDAMRLVQVLGYQFSQPCGRKTASLATANAERAFLTVDSGFPLTELEESLQKGKPFSYSFPQTRLPILLTQNDWMSISTWRSGNLIDILIHDPDMDRLYWALSKSDQQTRMALAQSPGLRKLLAVAPVFDMYGGRICIHSGKVEVPGGAGAEEAWEHLVGASPKSAGDFVNHLLSADHGWLAAYYDAVSRIHPAQQIPFTEKARLKRLYDAYRSTTAGTLATAGVYPKNADLLMLLTRLQWEANGDPRIPGTLADWAEIFNRDAGSKSFHDWAKHNHSWESPEKFLEGLVASSNLVTDSGPLQMYLMLSAINDARPADRHLSDETVRLMAGKFAQYNTWYLVFAEFPDLDDSSIARFVATADQINGIPGPTLRANALGSFQAIVGLWQILARQQQIANGALNTSWQNVVQPFTGISSSVRLFEAARGSLKSLLAASAGKGDLSQDEIVDVLAGPAQESPDGRRVHDELAARMRAVLEDQRLASLDTLFGLYDGLTEMAHGHAVGDSLLPLAASLREFEMPRPIFTQSEKTAWSPLIYSSRHAELQIRTDLTRVIRSSPSAVQLETARGWLAPFLRDTLVGLNYAYYEPPGAQVLHNNPLFVRSHDFSGSSIQGIQRIWGAPDLVGIGATAGGGAYLIGSLADLPYALASTEGDFIAPEKIQALIWKDTVPDLLVDAVLPRWWQVSRNELHAATLYQRAGEELLVAAGSDAQLRAKVIGILSDRMPPGVLDRTNQALHDPHSAAALVPLLPPADTFYLAVEFRKRFPDQTSAWGAAGRELDDLVHKDQADASPERLSRDFGVPHPTLADTDTCALLNTGPLPAFGGNASNLFGESWESDNLYWARLADEMGYSPVMLNMLAPALTRRMIANIFATNIDDWPALLRAMKETGEEFRQGKITVEAAGTVARQQESSTLECASCGSER